MLEVVEVDLHLAQRRDEGCEQIARQVGRLAADFQPAEQIALAGHASLALGGVPSRHQEVLMVLL